MKATSLRLKDNDGQPVKGWKITRFTDAYNCGGTLLRPRRISGWSIHDADGTERPCEGSYLDCVPYFNLVLENHGIATRLS